MTLTFFFEKNSYFSGVMHSGIKIRISGTTTVAFLEHNCHIFRTQLPHPWNTTVTSLERNVLAVWRGVWLQHYDRSNYNTETVLI